MTTAPTADRRAGGAAVAGGLLLAASVGAELLHPVQASDGTVLQDGLFAGYLAVWTVGAALLARAAAGLGGASRAAQTGRVLNLTGFVLLFVFGVVVLATGLLGRPWEPSFVAFALGLLMVAAGSLTAGIARGRAGWPLMLAAGGALVALLTEELHDVGLFVLFGAWVVIGLLRRARQEAVVGTPVA